MPLRIVVRETAEALELGLHGWLSGPEVAEFERACEGERPLCLDLCGLTGADAAGVLSLRDKQARGARLTGVSPYIALLLGGPSTRPRGEEEGED